MFLISISSIAALIAARALFLVARHALLLAEVGIRIALTVAAVLLLIAPLVLWLGVLTIGPIPSIALAACCCVPGLLMGHKAIQALERTGRDDVKEAMEGLMGTAIGTLTFIGFVAVYVFVWQPYV